MLCHEDEVQSRSAARQKQDTLGRGHISSLIRHPFSGLWTLTVHQDTSYIIKIQYMNAIEVNTITHCPELVMVKHGSSPESLMQLGDTVTGMYPETYVFISHHLTAGTQQVPTGTQEVPTGTQQVPTGTNTYSLLLLRIIRPSCPYPYSVKNNHRT